MFQDLGIIQTPQHPNNPSGWKASPTAPILSRCSCDEGQKTAFPTQVIQSTLLSRIESIEKIEYNVAWEKRLFSGSVGTFKHNSNFQAGRSLPHSIPAVDGTGIFHKQE
jgi:hypothetical protein